MIALLCSVDAEAADLLAAIMDLNSASRGSKAFATGLLFGQQVALCAGGMGKVNAAHAAALLFTQYAPDLLVIFGIGGAYPSSGAQVGDLALARSETAADEGVVTMDGFHDTEYIGIPLVRTGAQIRYNSFPAPEALLAQAEVALRKAGGPDTAAVHVGPFLTLSTCTGTDARARELEDRYAALCENMEGAAAAQVAVLHGIPWIEVRGISNIVEDRDMRKWNIPLAAAAVQRAVRSIVEDITL